MLSEWSTSPETCAGTERRDLRPPGQHRVRALPLLHCGVQQFLLGGGLPPPPPSAAWGYFRHGARLVRLRRQQQNHGHHGNAGDCSWDCSTHYFSLVKTDKISVHSNLHREMPKQGPERPVHPPLSSSPACHTRPHQAGGPISQGPCETRPPQLSLPFT